MDYMLFFNDQEQQESNIKAFFICNDILEDNDTAIQQDSSNAFFICSDDGIIYNRDITIIDSKSHTIQDNRDRQIKRIGLTIQEKKLLRQLRR
jgi:hypothetical protein